MSEANSSLEDQEFLDSYESGEWNSVSNLEQEIKQYQDYAIAWLGKNAFVSVPLPAKDLDQLKKKANDVGIPYQALIADLVHRFVTGK